MAPMLWEVGGKDSGPKGRIGFQVIHQHFHRLECIGAMGPYRRHQNNGLARLDHPDAMDHQKSGQEKRAATSWVMRVISFSVKPSYWSRRILPPPRPCSRSGNSRRT